MSEQQTSDFERFEAALYEWNKVKNLTRIPLEECATKHFLDSLLVGAVIRDFCPGAIKILDVGAGPGFPAWPLALVFPEWHVTAVDSNGKMLDFLRANPLPNLTVVQRRVEEWNQFGKFDVATGRAVAPLAVQLEMSLPWVKSGGWLVPMRTPTDVLPSSALLVSRGLRLESVQKRLLGQTEIGRVFPVLTKLSDSNHKSLRKWSEIKNKPWF